MEASVCNNRSNCSLGKVVTLFIAALILLSAATTILTLETARAAHADSTDKSPTLELRVDSVRHARVFCNGVQVMSSLCDFFEFYEQSLTGRRKRILSGPWGGRLQELSPGSYSLAGNDPASGADYTIIFKQTDALTIELFMTFKAPSRSANLGFDIAKLSGDLFKGGTVVASPASLNDAKGVPLEPRSLAARMLLADKNRVLVRGALCDIEVTDLADTKSMYVADGRNIPWDKFKSVIFGASALNLAPGSRHSFRYAIRCLPPSRPDLAQDAKATFRPIEVVKEWSFFTVTPKKEIKTTGHYRLLAGEHVYGSLTGTAEAVLAMEIAKLTSLRLDVRASGTAMAKRGLIIERVPQGARPDIPAEGFEIIITQNRVVVRGADERGCLYGVYVLLGRFARKTDVWGIDCGTIKDWPDLPVRGGCLEMLPPAIKDVEVMKRYLDAFSRARSNVVIFLHVPQQVRSWSRNAIDGNWTKSQMAEIAGYARSLHMEVWGGMGSAFKPADFREMDIRTGGNFYNPSNEKNYQYIFSLYDELLKAYAPSTLLISHDEIQGLSMYAAESGKTTAEILAMDVNRIRDWLANRNVRTAMWGDMLLDHERWETEVGAANSNNPFFKSGATHAALQKIPKDVFILDWHYDEKKSYASIDYFRKNGFHVAGAPWHDPKAARNLARSAKEFGGQGVIATDWGFWRTMSPAATTLYAPLCGWSASCQIDPNTDVAALAKTVRAPVYDGNSYKQTPVSLGEVSNRSTRELFEGSNDALFGVGSILDLRAFSAGKQVLGGILFDTQSCNDGKRQNCVVAAGAGHRFATGPKALTVFKGNALAREIAFLHTGFVEEPSTTVRKLGRYLVEYDGGGSETIDILENWNITDIRSTEGLRHNTWTFLRSPAVLIGAKPAWQGNSAIGIPLNLQLFIWRNPHPEKKIRSIKFATTDEPTGTALALLGLTFLHE